MPMKFLSKLWRDNAPVDGKIVGAKARTLVNDGMGGYPEKHVDIGLLKPGVSYVFFKKVNPMADYYGPFGVKGWGKLKDIQEGGYSERLVLEVDGKEISISLTDAKKCIPEPTASIS